MIADPRVDERLAARGRLAAALDKAAREAETARITLALADHPGGAVDTSQLDYALRSAVSAGAALEEARDLYHAAHGRGRRRT